MLVHELGNHAEARPIGLGMLDDEGHDVYQHAIEHRGEAMECAKLLLVRVVGMLSKLCR